MATELFVVLFAGEAQPCTSIEPESGSDFRKGIDDLVGGGVFKVLKIERLGNAALFCGGGKKNPGKGEKCRLKEEFGFHVQSLSLVDGSFFLTWDKILAEGEKVNVKKYLLDV